MLGEVKDSNVLGSSSIALGAVPATKVRVVMREAIGSLLMSCVVASWLATVRGMGVVVGHKGIHKKRHRDQAHIHFDDNMHLS